MIILFLVYYTFFTIYFSFLQECHYGTFFKIVLNFSWIDHTISRFLHVSLPQTVSAGILSLCTTNLLGMNYFMVLDNSDTICFSCSHQGNVVHKTSSFFCNCKSLTCCNPSCIDKSLVSHPVWDTFPQPQSA